MPNRAQRTSELETLGGSNINAQADYETKFKKSNCIGQRCGSPDHWASLFGRRARPLDMRDSGTAANLSSVCCGGGLFVAVGDSGTILISSNRVQWMTRTSGADLPLFRVAFASGLFVAVGGSEADTAMILRSGNGLNWIQTSNNIQGVLRSVTHGNGMFVAVGDSGIATSSNGVTWSAALCWAVLECRIRQRHVRRRRARARSRLARWSHTDTRPDDPLVVPGISFGNGLSSRTTRVFGRRRTAFSRRNNSVVLHGVAYGDGLFVAIGCGSW
jgi:hypothetical protein